MKPVGYLLLLMATSACALEGEAGLGTQADAQQRPQPAWEPSADKSAALGEEEYPVLLGTKTATTQEFTVKATHRWKECEGGEEPRVKVIFVCKVDANNNRERCYSIEPLSTDHQTDPYLSCDFTAEPWQCMSQILENGNYHVGVLYENSTCGQYAFWWHSVLFSQRQLSASLVPVNEPNRHLDHRMAQVLNTPAANSRYLQAGAVAQLELDMDAGNVHHVYLRTQGVVKITSPDRVCYQYSHELYPDHESWWCQGSEQQSNVTLLLETTDAGTEIFVEASMDEQPSLVRPEKRVLFTGIEQRWATYLPFL